MKILEQSLCTAYQLYNRDSNLVQVFCFIYDGKRLLSIGQNEMVNESSKALYFGKRFNLPHLVKYPFIHAEIDAVSKLWGKHRIEGDEKVVVVRLKKSGTSATARKILVPAIAKPCENCYNVLSALGIKKVWWTNENGEFEQARNSKNGLDNGR